MARLIALSLVLALSACSSMTPYLSARHQSDPSISDDGYDLGCGGVKWRGQFSVKVGGCKNIRGGEVAEFEIEYEVFK